MCCGPWPRTCSRTWTWWWSTACPAARWIRRHRVSAPRHAWGWMQRAGPISTASARASMPPRWRARLHCWHGWSVRHPTCREARLRDNPLKTVDSSFHPIDKSTANVVPSLRRCHAGLTRQDRRGLRTRGWQDHPARGSAGTLATR
ncbi:protein of unknown function [Cupriavidus neocaledonicus]|uniref:Uncharacterized protein n=1 Tax=Cupriavidus neocaledonicus TaxID=1040979 RepID=A0A375HCW0_9BURK|nr:hypothetical protein CBM2605_A260102 [Cupriavidus neocaledonicus]SPD48223.1 protein of unknown function [Cupriavidus neocaledonicus]